MVIYFETSAVNYVADNVHPKDIPLLRDGLKLMDDGKSILCLSPVTMWEIVCTGDDERKEKLIATCQTLFEDGCVYPGPFAIMDEYTAAGCPKKQEMFEFTKTAGRFADVWREISSDPERTMVIQSELVDEDGKNSSRTSRILQKLIKSNFSDSVYPDDELYTTVCQWINSVYSSLHLLEEKSEIPEKLEKVYKSGIYFATSLLITGIASGFDNCEVIDFWKKRGVDDIGHQMRYLFCHYEAILYRGPILYMAMMAVSQTEGKGNRGLYKDCMHAMYMAYCDVFFTNDKHFLELKNAEPKGFWGKIVSINDVWNDFLNCANAST